MDCTSVYIMYLLLVGKVLSYINSCRLFNAKSCLYIYIKYIWFVKNILNKPELIFLHTVAWLQVFHSNTNNSIQCYLFICTQLNGFKYCYVTLTIHFNSVIYQHIVKWLNSSIWPIDGTLISTIILGHSWSGSNGNESAIYIPQNSRAGASPSDAV